MHANLHAYYNMEKQNNGRHTRSFNLRLVTTRHFLLHAHNFEPKCYTSVGESKHSRNQHQGLTSDVTVTFIPPHD